MRRILHTESSNGWGGQEIRILREAEGMRLRGYEVILAVAKGGGLIAKARSAGFLVYELSFKKKSALWTVMQLVRIILKERIDLVNTHSSLDAWLGGIAARLTSKKIIRTRHLSTAIREGLNSRLLYKSLADFVVTTSSSIIPVICDQSKRCITSCRCIPTGVDPSRIKVDMQKVSAFRAQLGLKPNDLLAGTACFVRSWKGIKDLLKAAELLKDLSCLKWIVVGGGYVDEYKLLADKMNLSSTVFFTGHLESPFEAIAAMDIFLLLSTAHEGISQASLQAAYLEKPLITTPIGGLPEVCLNEKTGIIVPVCSPEKVQEAVLRLKNAPLERLNMGKRAKELVEKKFTLTQTLQEMDEVYQSLLNSSSP